VKRLSYFLILIVSLYLLPAFCQEKSFDIYTDKTSPKNHYAPSGWMGDYGDLELNDECKVDPFEGTTCIKIVYSAKKSQGKGWAGIYWQNPPNNWGERKGGYDLTGFNKLVFWAKGEKGTEIINKVKIGGIKGAYPDSTEVEIGPIQLTKEWKEYSINLVGKDLSYISGGFCIIFTADQNPEGCTIYLDNIKYVYEPGLEPEAKKVTFPFYIYADAKSLDNHYIPSGYMGDWGDLKVDQSCTENPYSGQTCIKITYTGKCSQGARWAGIYWQNPANNWGTADGGYDLTGATRLTFWARGQKGGERIEEFKVGGIMGEYSDSDSASIGPVILTKEWRKYTIDLRGKDLSYIIGGFCFSLNVDNNPQGCTFYLDEIKFEKD